MPRTRLLSEEQLNELLASKNKQERIKLAVKFNLGYQNVLNLYNYYRSRAAKETKQEQVYEPLQMIMMPTLKSNEIKVNGNIMEFPGNKAVIQGIEFSW